MVTNDPFLLIKDLTHQRNWITWLKLYDYKIEKKKKWIILLNILFNK